MSKDPIRSADDYRRYSIDMLKLRFLTLLFATNLFQMETICCLEKKSLYYNYIKLLPKSYEQRRMKWYNFGNDFLSCING